MYNISQKWFRMALVIRHLCHGITGFKAEKMTITESSMPFFRRLLWNCYNWSYHPLKFPTETWAGNESTLRAFLSANTSSASGRSLQSKAAAAAAVILR